VWVLARRQHGVVSRTQLRELGFTRHAIEHRIAEGRLHPLWRGVYAVGRPGVTQHGHWMAAVLACGPEAVLTHEAAAALWEIREPQQAQIEVAVLARAPRRRPGITVCRRASLSADDLTRHRGIPVTSPIGTLVDLATRLGPHQLESAVNEADNHDLIAPDGLRHALDAFAGQPGVRPLRLLLDRATFRLTDSELERRFLPLVRAAGLPSPQTRRRVNGFRVDFYWPELGLVVETDGLQYHRTPAQQTRDRVRDQAHAAAGLTPLRFTHAQVRFQPDSVRATLIAVAHNLRA
jgi:very-short-patch-repair endonuclease